MCECVFFLAASDNDRPRDTLKYQVLKSWWGNVSLVTDQHTPLQYFTQELIDRNLVAFCHQSKLCLEKKILTSLILKLYFNFGFNYEGLATKKHIRKQNIIFLHNVLLIPFFFCNCPIFLAKNSFAVLTL